MKTRYAFCLALTVTGAAVLPVPVSAQALLPPYEITTSVRSMGLEPISPPIRRGPRYVLRAIDGRGGVVAVAADAMNGRILAVRPVGYDHENRYQRGPVYVERDYPYYREGNAPYYRDDIAPPRGVYQGPPSYVPPEPKVIPAPRDSANSAPPPVRTPLPAAKPPAPKVAAKPPAKPVSAEAIAKTEPPAENATAKSTATTGSTSLPPAEKNSTLAIPPVQSFE